MKLQIVNDWNWIDTAIEILDMEIVLFNVALLGLYINRYQTQVTLLGYSFLFWYDTVDENGKHI